jgi:membrane protein implicated in regulation of membrane protease activity
MMIILLGAAALLVGAIASLALGSWWLLLVVVGLHAVASVVVVLYAGKRATEDYDKPDPVTEARLEAEDGGADEAPKGDGRTPGDREVLY